MHIEKLHSPPPMASVLFADFEQPAADGLVRELVATGYTVSTQHSSVACVAELEKRIYDLLIVRDASAEERRIEMLGRLPRRDQNLPTLLISKTPALPDVVRALNAGADDIVPLSTSDQELASRATAVLRRAGVIRYLADGHLNESCRQSGLDDVIKSLNRHIQRSGATIFKSDDGYVIRLDGITPEPERGF